MITDQSPGGLSGADAVRLLLGMDPPECAADRGLAELLRRRAAPVPPPGDWAGSFRYLLSEALDTGTASLQEMARSMAVSPRTLQRRLAECGTSWRAELDALRRQRVRRGARTMTALARDLGYTDPRSARRAVRRWAGAAGPYAARSGDAGAPPSEPPGQDRTQSACLRR